jgi:hypothetical protein
MEIIAFILIMGFGALLFGGISTMKPETVAQRRRREWNDAAREARQMHNITQDVYKRMNKRHKRQKYKPSRSEIARRVRERRND